VPEKAGFFLIKTRNERGLLLELFSETTRPQRSLVTRALFFLKCLLGALRIVVSLEVLF
jgi:hypothetical protein